MEFLQWETLTLVGEGGIGNREEWQSESIQKMRITSTPGL